MTSTQRQDLRKSYEPRREIDESGALRHFCDHYRIDSDFVMMGGALIS